MNLGAIWYAFVKAILAAWFRLQFRLRAEGVGHEPSSGAVLVVANHVSALDPLLVGVKMRRRCAFMAKEELLRVPVLGRVLRTLGVFAVRRGEPDRRSIRTALDLLAQGRVVIMFPEGTRSPDGRLQRAEPGAALLALRSGATVLPAVVVGSHRALPRGRWWPRRVPLVVRFGPTIQVPRVEGRVDRAMLAEWGERFMAALAALLPPEQQPLAPPARAPSGGVGER